VRTMHADTLDILSDGQCSCLTACNLHLPHDYAGTIVRAAGPHMDDQRTFRLPILNAVKHARALLQSNSKTRLFTRCRARCLLTDMAALKLLA
jgi:hypothetical protein